MRINLELMSRPILFVKASKIIALAVNFLPIAGCAIGTGIIFGSLVKAVAYAPENEDSLFNYATMGFAFIETFAFILVLTALFIVSF